MNDNDSQANDNQQDDQGILDKVKNAIPGDLDDKIIDGAQAAMGGTADGAQAAAGAAGGVVGDVLDKVTDMIPGEMDDKLVDGAKAAMDNAGGVVDKLKDMNPMNKDSN